MNHGNYLTGLICSCCQAEWDPGQLLNVCPDCHKPLLARYDLNQIRDVLPREDLSHREATIWRYRELLPVADPARRLTLGEGMTPLIEATRLSAALGGGVLFIKDEGNNPTGSFKARGLAVAVSRAWELGVREVSIPSAGNAAGAMSAYAALAGLPAHVYMPADVPVSFVTECKTFGAEVTLVTGLITDCGKLSVRLAARNHWFDLSTLKEPYRLEGKKTMGLELAEQMNWNLPDVIIYPTGGGTGLIGMWKAFDEMQRLGWIDGRRPRMTCVQAEGCAPIVRAFNNQQEFADPWIDARTVADGLRVPQAIGDFLILDILRKSKGTAVTVSDEEMLEGVRMMGHAQGLFVSPESGGTVIAYMKLKKEGWIAPGESVVLFNTGSGYKYSHLWQ